MLSPKLQQQLRMKVIHRVQRSPVPGPFENDDGFKTFPRSVQCSSTVIQIAYVTRDVKRLSVCMFLMTKTSETKSQNLWSLIKNCELFEISSAVRHSIIVGCSCAIAMNVTTSIKQV